MRRAPLSGVWSLVLAAFLAAAASVRAEEPTTTTTYLIGETEEFRLSLRVKSPAGLLDEDWLAFEMENKTGEALRITYLACLFRFDLPEQPWNQWSGSADAILRELGLSQSNGLGRSSSAEFPAGLSVATRELSIDTAGVLGAEKRWVSGLFYCDVYVDWDGVLSTRPDGFPIEFEWTGTDDATTESIQMRARHYLDEDMSARDFARGRGRYVGTLLKVAPLPVEELVQRRREAYADSGKRLQRWVLRQALLQFEEHPLVVRNEIHLYRSALLKDPNELVGFNESYVEMLLEKLPDLHSADLSTHLGWFRDTREKWSPNQAVQDRLTRKFLTEFPFVLNSRYEVPDAGSRRRWAHLTLLPHISGELRLVGVLKPHLQDKRSTGSDPLWRDGRVYSDEKLKSDGPIFDRIADAAYRRILIILWQEEALPPGYFESMEPLERFDDMDAVYAHRDKEIARLLEWLETPEMLEKTDATELRSWFEE